jgi:O-antigen/teichoic acid export membrane protein
LFCRIENLIKFIIVIRICNTLRRLKFIDNISGLQLFQLMRPITFLIVSIVFTKTLTIEQVGQFEMFMFIGGALTFFWVTGIIQSLLTLYNKNKTYHKSGDNGTAKSPEIFNAFILLCIFSLFMFVMGHLLKNHFSVFHNTGNVPYLNLLLLYVLLSSPVCLIEYIYLLNNRSYRIFQYGLITFSAQLILIVLPIVLGQDFLWSIWGLLLITSIRWIWLLILIKRYSEMRLSFKFMKEHLYLGIPLIATTLISGSAQYVDGTIISAHFKDEATFAIFRFGAKEFQLVIMLATGLSTALLSEFSTREKMNDSLIMLKEKSKKLMHFLFPASMIAMLMANWVYTHIFGPEYARSADIFMVYLLLVIPRLVFPQTIIIGRKRTNIALITAVFAQLINIPLSLALIQPYGVVGVALATFIVYTIEKVFLVLYVKVKMKINPTDYIPVRLFAAYSVLIAILFILIDHRIINIY